MDFKPNEEDEEIEIYEKPMKFHRWEDLSVRKKLIVFGILLAFVMFMVFAFSYQLGINAVNCPVCPVCIL